MIENQQISLLTELKKLNDFKTVDTLLNDDDLQKVGVNRFPALYLAFGNSQFEKLSDYIYRTKTTYRAFVCCSTARSKEYGQTQAFGLVDKVVDVALEFGEIKSVDNIFSNGGAVALMVSFEVEEKGNYGQ